MNFINYRKHNSARQKLSYAIKTGKIVRPVTCSNCQKECMVEAHHVDYNKPLNVIWLCEKCHRELHRGLYFEDHYEKTA
jgi:hypothetical protein